MTSKTRVVTIRTGSRVLSGGTTWTGGGGFDLQNSLSSQLRNDGLEVARRIFHFLSGHIGGVENLRADAEENIPVRADGHGSGRTGEQRVTLLHTRPELAA